MEQEGQGSFDLVQTPDDKKPGPEYNIWHHSSITLCKSNKGLFCSLLVIFRDLNTKQDQEHALLVLLTST